MEDIIKEFLKLQQRTPRSALYQVVNFNSVFTNYTDGLKNCYLISNAFECEETFYGRNLSYNRDCIDCDHCHHCELCYECINCLRCYNSSFLQDCEDSTDCSFGYDLRGCRNCFGCVSLRQKEFHIFNKLYSKGHYAEELKKLEENRGEIYMRFQKLKESTPRRFAVLHQSEEVVGNYLTNSKNCFYCFDTNDSQDCLYCYEVKKSTDCIDITVGEFMIGNFECQSGWKSQNCKFCNNCWESSDLEYCDEVFRSHYCFFCIYLNHRNFYILNKPYSKEEYFKKVAAVKNQLRERGLYGNWFIPSTYPFEDTCASMLYM